MPFSTRHFYMILIAAEKSGSVGRIIANTDGSFTLTVTRGELGYLSGHQTVDEETWEVVNDRPRVCSTKRVGVVLA